MPVTVSKPFLISTEGSTRATAYDVANKSVRIGDVTHITWLDAIAGVRMRSFDHRTGVWSPTLALDEGADNHCNPALTVTPDGKLRVAYGPHSFWEEGMFNHARFRMQESANGLDWQPISDMGYGATYACLVTDSQGRDHLVYRGGPDPSDVFYERRLPLGCWDLTTKLSVQRVKPDYTFVNANLVIGPGDVLFCGFMYYYQVLATGKFQSAGVAILKSPDGGETWLGIDGRPAKLPLAYDSAFAIPHGGHTPYLGSLAMDQDGHVVALTHDSADKIPGTSLPPSNFLSVFRDGSWQTTGLDGILPDGWLINRGNCTVDAGGRILITVDAYRRETGNCWGVPSLECFLMVSEDKGKSFEALQISTTNPTMPNWLPNISRTGPNHNLDTPLVLYTHGVAGETCKPPDKTEVYGVWVEHA